MHDGSRVSEFECTKGRKLLPRGGACVSSFASILARECDKTIVNDQPEMFRIVARAYRSSRIT